MHSVAFCVKFCKRKLITASILHLDACDCPTKAAAMKSSTVCLAELDTSIHVMGLSELLLYYWHHFKGAGIEKFLKRYPALTTKSGWLIDSSVGHFFTINGLTVQLRTEYDEKCPSKGRNVCFTNSPQPKDIQFTWILNWKKAANLYSLKSGVSECCLMNDVNAQYAISDIVSCVQVLWNHGNCLHCWTSTTGN